MNEIAVRKYSLYAECVEELHSGKVPEGIDWEDNDDGTAKLPLAHVACTLGMLPDKFTKWDIRGPRDRTVAHVQATLGPLPDTFNEWGMTDADSISVAGVALDNDNLPDDFKEWHLPYNSHMNIASKAARMGKLPSDFNQWTVYPEAFKEMLDKADDDTIKKILEKYPVDTVMGDSYVAEYLLSYDRIKYVLGNIDLSLKGTDTSTTLADAIVSNLSLAIWNGIDIRRDYTTIHNSTGDNALKYNIDRTIHEYEPWMGNVKDIYGVPFIIHALKNDGDMAYRADVPWDMVFRYHTRDKCLDPLKVGEHYTVKQVFDEIIKPKHIRRIGFSYPILMGIASIRNFFKS